MSPKAEVWILPTLRPSAVDPFLRALAPQFSLAAQLDLRLHPTPDGSLVVLLPAAKQADSASMASLRGHLAQAFETAGRRASELDNLPLQSRDITNDAALCPGILALVADRVLLGANAQEPPEDTLRAVVEGDLPSAMAALIRRSRDAQVVAGWASGPKDSLPVAMADLVDDPDRGATIDGLRAAGLPPGVTLLRRHSLAAMSFWLPEDSGFPDQDRLFVSTLLNGLADAGLLDRRADLHLLPMGEGRDLRLVLLPPDPAAREEASGPFIEAAEIAQAIDGPAISSDLGPALRLDLRTLRPDTEAQKDLNARLNDRRFPIGYRIQLAPVPDRHAGDGDLEQLRSEIDEREARIALIQALGRPQMRLLRFLDAQLPALVDGLRRMPAALRENAGLLYAAAHAAGRAEPAHFILYDPDKVQFDGVLPEFYWRAMIGDSPMRFWLDPHAEEARDGRPGEPTVFVPDGARILPYIDSFGASLSGTLRLVLGNLFADASAVLTRPGTQPAFVFRTLSGEADEIGVELLDLAAFRPLRVSLRWINDHILAASPRVADPASLRELAESLYSGQLALTLRAEMDAVVAGLARDWHQAEAELAHGLDRLGEAVAAQIDGLRSRLVAARTLAAAAERRLPRLEGAADDLAAAMARVESRLNATAVDIPARATARLAFVAQFEAELAAGERLIDEARHEIDGLRTRLSALRQEIGR